VSGAQQLKYDVAPDEPRASGDQNCAHRIVPPLLAVF
jgi:hypothetical protein